jgi:hypothetical protein
MCDSSRKYTRLIGLDVRVCMVSTSVDNDPLPSVENAANNALNKAKVHRLKSAKCCVLPETIPALDRVALFDDREEQCLWLLEAEPWGCKDVDFYDPLKFSEERVEHHVWLLVLGLCVAVDGRLVLPKSLCVGRWELEVGF